MDQSIIVPNIVFIVPYRNRASHKLFFTRYMTPLLEDLNYEIYFSHQNDERAFNRGAMKNIGFLAVKQKYPDDYQNMTFVFNDIDTVPFDKILNYETEKGIVKHFYGFTNALGGIVSFKGCDFELINGYPNFWGWGMEDAVLQKRCQKYNLIIDRNHFFSIGSPEILHLFDGVSRIINKEDVIHSKNIHDIDGIKTLYNIKYSVDNESSNPLDNIHTIINDHVQIVNVNYFSCSTKFEHAQFHEYDLREPTKKILQTNRVKDSSFVENQWSNIPFYPNQKEKKEMIEKYGFERTENIIQHNLNKYSSGYANSIGHKPKASCSANIGLGGIK